MKCSDLTTGRLFWRYSARDLSDRQEREAIVRLCGEARITVGIIVPTVYASINGMQAQLDACFDETSHSRIEDRDDRRLRHLPVTRAWVARAELRHSRDRLWIHAFPRGRAPAVFDMRTGFDLLFFDDQVPQYWEIYRIMRQCSPSVRPQ